MVYELSRNQIDSLILSIETGINCFIVNQTKFSVTQNTNTFGSFFYIIQLLQQLQLECSQTQSQHHITASLKLKTTPTPELRKRDANMW